ncbi:MAG: hypothetical protein H3Z52_05105 [archaeon]|nr:hypothetical protein [archaeon]MCP8320304.1 hypothetical protein [archaeon]
MKVGRGELWKGKRAEGLSLILCEEHLKEMIDNLYADRTLISAMLEPLEDVDESTVKREHLSSEHDKCQIPECKRLARFKFTSFRSIKLREWHKLKPPP